MTLNLIFDIDDTVYDQLAPFKKAFTEIFPKLQATTDLEELYKLHRHFSDVVFADFESGKIELWEMRAYRITAALETTHVTITKEQALAFEHSYSHFLTEIQMQPAIKAVLETGVAQNLTMGVITNGPSERQRGKIAQLGVLNYLPEKNCFISGEVQLAKPNSELFKYVEKQLGISPAETIYIGDSFENDVMGAKNAGWRVIWLNQRKRTVPTAQVQPDYTLTDVAELPALIAKLLEQV